MNLNDAHALVAEQLGNGWRIQQVDSRLVAGRKEGAPTGRLVTVRLVQESDAGRSTYQGEGGTLEDALSVAIGGLRGAG